MSDYLWAVQNQMGPHEPGEQVQEEKRFHDLLMQVLREAAVKALTDEVYAQFNCQYGDFNTPSEEEAESIIAAAEPHLRKKWAEELERAMFKVESVHHFGFGEYGIKCLCGFESLRNRSRTEHITKAVRNLLEGAGE